MQVWCNPHSLLPNNGARSLRDIDDAIEIRLDPGLRTMTGSVRTRQEITVPVCGNRSLWSRLSSDTERFGAATKGAVIS
jgi:hypothetical protein